MNQAICFDEAGNTGDNLLDKDQPVYLLLSHNFTDEEAATILQPLSSVSKASELHFKQIKKYTATRQALLRCLEHHLIQPDRVYYYVAHKRFMIIIQLVDKLFETVCYKHGIDLYKGGSNLSTANIIYILGTVAWDKELFDNMCRAFVRWTRSADPADEEHFYKAVELLYNSIESKEEQLFPGMILQSRLYKDQFLHSFGKYSMDATLSCFIEHCMHWQSSGVPNLDILVDKSKQLSYWKGMIDFLTQDVPQAKVGFGSRKRTYPLPINTLSQGDSGSNLRIQLADVLASSINYLHAGNLNQSKNDLTREIERRVAGFPHHAMWPTSLVTPEELDMTDRLGRNPLDFIAGVAMDKPAAYAKIDRTK